LKLCTHDYLGEVTCHASFGFNRYSGGFSPNRVNIITLWLFWLSCPILSLPFLRDSAARSNRWTDFYALWLKRRVSAQGWSFWGLERWVTIFGENMPSKPPKMGLNRQFQANTAKYKNRKYLQNYKSDQDQIWEPSWDRQLHFVGGLTIRRWNPVWLPAAILRKWIWRHNSADDCPITTKFGNQMQNGMPMTIRRSKSKPELEFQYDRCQFSKTGSISRVLRYIIEIVRQIDFCLFKQMPSLSLNPKVDFQLYGRDIGKKICSSYLNSPVDIIFPGTDSLRC